jgi:outer membrane protein assembly factor BamE (lipoprotein component of BamABCDE complex)
MSTGSDHGSVVTEEQIFGIEAGTTTKTDVLRALGNPDQRIDLGGGKEQFSYIRETIRTTRQKGILLPTSNIQTTSQHSEFWIVFQNDIVAEKGCSNEISNKESSNTSVHFKF